MRSLWVFIVVAVLLVQVGFSAYAAVEPPAPTDVVEAPGDAPVGGGPKPSGGTKKSVTGTDSTGASVDTISPGGQQITSRGCTVSELAVATEEQRRICEARRGMVVGRTPDGGTFTCDKVARACDVKHLKAAAEQGTLILIKDGQVVPLLLQDIQTPEGTYRGTDEIFNLSFADPTPERLSPLQQQAYGVFLQDISIAAALPTPVAGVTVETNGLPEDTMVVLRENRATLAEAVRNPNVVRILPPVEPLAPVEPRGGTTFTATTFGEAPPDERSFATRVHDWFFPPVAAEPARPDVAAEAGVPPPPATPRRGPLSFLDYARGAGGEPPPAVVTTDKPFTQRLVNDDPDAQPAVAVAVTNPKLQDRLLPTGEDSPWNMPSAVVNVGSTEVKVDGRVVTKELNTSIVTPAYLLVHPGGVPLTAEEITARTADGTATDWGDARVYVPAGYASGGEIEYRDAGTPAEYADRVALSLKASVRDAATERGVLDLAIAGGQARPGDYVLRIQDTATGQAQYKVGREGQEEPVLIYRDEASTLHGPAGGAPIVDVEDFTSLGAVRTNQPFLIAHDTEGSTAAGAIATLRDRGFSYNEVIDKDGTRYRLVPFTDGSGGGAGVIRVDGEHFGQSVRSFNSVHVAFVRVSDEPLTEAQLRTFSQETLPELEALYPGITTRMYAHPEIASKDEGEAYEISTVTRAGGFEAHYGIPLGSQSTFVAYNAETGQPLVSASGQPVSLRPPRIEAGDFRIVSLRPVVNIGGEVAQPFEIRYEPPVAPVALPPAPGPIARGLARVRDTTADTVSGVTRALTNFLRPTPSAFGAAPTMGTAGLFGGLPFQAPMLAPLPPLVSATPALLSFSCKPSAVIDGAPTTIEWACSGGGLSVGTEFETKGAGSGSVSQVITTTESSKRFGISCGGAAVRSCVVRVLHPRVSIVVSLSEVEPGEQSRISWAGADVTVCALVGPGPIELGGSATRVGSAMTKPLTRSTRFRMACGTEAGKPIYQEITVAVKGDTQPPIDTVLPRGLMEGPAPSFVYTSSAVGSAAGAPVGAGALAGVAPTGTPPPGTFAGTDTQGNSVYLCDPAVGMSRFIWCLTNGKY
ncbi:MAG: N-acetylmuramoyl-L-alanine amidase [Patescibacteria group bacterium]